METGDVLYGGDWKEPDYRTLIREKAKLALMSAQVLPLNADVLAEREEEPNQEEEALTVEEYRERLTDLTDRFAVLDIPLLMIRSDDELERKGQAEWLKLYGVLFGQEETAQKIYDQILEEEDPS